LPVEAEASSADSRCGDSERRAPHKRTAGNHCFLTEATKVTQLLRAVDLILSPPTNSGTNSQQRFWYFT
jgi:hypothetical protein